MDDDGPRVLRPVPRRPFDLSFTSATTRQDDDADRHDASSTPTTPSDQWGNDASSPRFLNANLDRTDPTTPLTRPQSWLNLTSSTLMGIYSEAASSHSRDYLVHDDEECDTPWGTGARTPIRHPSMDEATYELMRDRSHPSRRKSSFGPYPRDEDVGPASFAANATFLILRGSLLCLLGLGSGGLVTRLHNEQNHLPRLVDDGIMKPGNNWRYLVFWGVGGVVLGSLLPWFDTVWARAFEQDSNKAGADGGNKNAGPGTDWALIMRAVGAFVGIVFAIRKLAWVSTLQLSATLALANPLLWWLIDRSKPGLVLSAVVGLAGSVFLVGVKPDLVSAPSAVSGRNTSLDFEDEPLALGGLASQETVETGIYMLSVLFCSCLCFGNIGRRLTWDKSSGRWGGIR